MNRGSFAWGLVVVLAALGCAPAYRGEAVPAPAPRALANEPGWVVIDGVPLVRQRARDCGPAALSAVLEYWHKPATPSQIRAALGRPASDRLKAGDLQAYAESRGLRAFTFYGSFDDIVHEIDAARPVVVGIAKPYSDKRALSHYEVVVGVNRERRRVLLMDPAEGWRENSFAGFVAEWQPTQRVTLVVFEST